MGSELLVAAAVAAAAVAAITNSNKREREGGVFILAETDRGRSLKTPRLLITSSKCVIPSAPGLERATIVA